MAYDDLILYDWFSFTAKHHGPDSLIDLLGMDATVFKTVKGARGYKDRLYFDGVSIHYGGREEVWCEMSGQGCRTFETFGHGAWDTLFEEVMSSKSYHVTRLDVAFDDHTGVFDLDVMADHVEKEGLFVSRYEKWGVLKSSDGITVTHGSTKSAIFFRIYDKARERGREDEGHWVRFELQMRDERASNFLAKLVLCPIGEAFTSVVNNYLRYIKPPIGGDTNKRRWPMADFWAAFIGEVGKMSLYESPGTEYNLEKLERYTVNQAGAAAAAYIEIVGVEEYLEQVQSRLIATSNPKYDDLIHKHTLVDDAR